MRTVSISETIYKDLESLARTLKLKSVDDLVHLICVKVLKYTKGQTTSSETSSPNTPKDEETIKKRLSDLGYL